ncbi:hypothetical protein QNI19_29120 [Cytophagaceae bacterium DM2B3-1]|uniref:Glycoside hydrolase family 65 n=1 Tax=Xanthocytophaga flava TaxID=3048013 RepID=A0ABT7CWP4_9BACT|nr:hypothetical protein [Xanthocytophaga flavus]MDJ1497034.1 hypothetical protein [Xanthocytophaga flavus]
MLVLLWHVTTISSQTPINRKAVVERHKVINTNADTLASLSVGNGKFAFTVDVTGLQTFPEFYAKGVPLGTQSEWGWHSFRDTVGYQFNESLKEYTLNGRKVTYSVQWSQPERNKQASNWFRQNPHRLQLGNLGLEIYKKNGTLVSVQDIKNIRQELNPWTGEIKSQFSVEGEAVVVWTYGHAQQDEVGVKIQSKLIAQGRLKVNLRFPYPTGDWTDVGTNYKQVDKHISNVETAKPQLASILHQLDTTTYYTLLKWKGNARVAQAQKHYFVVSPADKADVFELSCLFSPASISDVPSFTETQASSVQGWNAFWSRGGAVDFAGSTDPRAHELERRIILSQYLTKIQCVNSQPPQETGLTYNSWFGKPHLEMHWWHAIHFALWNRLDLLEHSLNWYQQVYQEAQNLAKRQGYTGARWQKMTDPEGKESPSSVGAFLIWQQPHFIYFAELCYRDKQDRAKLEKYKDLVFATADFMASYAWFDPAKGKYVLGKGVIPAQERYKPEETFNPTYELAYWHWGLSVAQQWRERLGMPRKAEWDEVLTKLSPLPEANGVYLAAESAPDSYTNPIYKTDHPSVLGTWGMLPVTPLLDKAAMRRTFDLIWNTWTWQDTWGWDFPMTAMTATRLGLPDKAVDALLMPIRTNTYLPNGHNFQDERLRLYLPGNGGFLAAIAMMCAGYDDAATNNPGFPKDGKWKVKWEGLQKMP